MTHVTIYGIPTGTENPYPEGFFCEGHEIADPPSPNAEMEYHSSTDVTKPPCDKWPWALDFD